MYILLYPIEDLCPAWLLRLDICVYSETIKSVSRLMVDGMDVFNQPFMQNSEVLNMITSMFKKLATEDLSKIACDRLSVL